MGQTEQALLAFDAPPEVLTRVQAAIAAAQAGDWNPADEMELDFLNDPKNGIYPGHLLATDDQVSDWQTAKAYRIERHDDGLHVHWIASERWGEKLERCTHKEADGVQRLCDECEDTGWRAPSPLMTIVTDIDGRIIDEDYEN